MQTVQLKYRRAIFGLVFVALLTLAGISLFSHGVLAQTDIVALTNKVYLPLISSPQNIGGTIPQ